MNRMFLMAGALCICALGHPASSASSKHQSKALPPSTSGWNRCSDKPEALVSLVEKQVSSLRGMGASVGILYQEKGGGHGYANDTVEIKDSRTFHLEYPEMSLIKPQKGGAGAAIAGATTVADGSRIGTWTIKKGLTKVLPIDQAPVLSTAPPVKWIYMFPELVFSALRGGHPFGNLVAVASKPGSGLTLTVDERRFDYSGVTFHQKRVTIASKPNVAKPVYVQLVFDATQRLPVNILTEGYGIGGIPTRITWEAHWGMPPRGKGFPKDAFTLPKLGAPVTK